MHINGSHAAFDGMTHKDGDIGLELVAQHIQQPSLGGQQAHGGALAARQHKAVNLIHQHWLLTSVVVITMNEDQRGRFGAPEQFGRQMRAHLGCAAAWPRVQRTLPGGPGRRCGWGWCQTSGVVFEGLEMN